MVFSIFRERKGPVEGTQRQTEMKRLEAPHGLSTQKRLVWGVYFEF
jgi:hypothetical protein